MVKKIQEFQKKFNEEFFPKAKEVNYDERLLFLSTALAGEVGEFANIVKKRHRKKLYNLEADNIPEEEYKERLKEEVTDVFIYTILLSNLLEMDLEEEYYKKSEKLKIKFKNGSIKR